MCGVVRLGSASRDQATGLVVGGTHHNSSKGDTADPVVWSLFCSGLGDCCPIFALFARGRADRSALTIHLLRSCWDPPFHIWFPGRRCSRGTLRVSSMLSPTNQSAARRLSSGTKNNQQLFNCFPALLCWKGPGSVMCRIRVLPARSKAWVGRCEGLSCLMGAVLLKVF